MKKIFILKGVSNVGKTTKILNIIEWIIRIYKVNENDIILTKTTENDVCGVIKIGNLIIGFNTAGDDENQIKKIDILISENEIDILICSCRTRGKTFQHLYKNYVRKNGWLDTYINVEELPKIDVL